MWLSRYAFRLSQNRCFTMRYTPDHEWIHFDSKTKSGTIGITEYAQGQLGDIVHISLPKAAEKFSQKAVMATIESVKVVSDIYAPVSGTVISVNTELKKSPEIINQDAEAKGWLFKMNLDHMEELETLMDKQGYDKMVKENSH